MIEKNKFIKNGDGLRADFATEVLKSISTLGMIFGFAVFFWVMFMFSRLAELVANLLMH